MVRQKLDRHGQTGRLLFTLLACAGLAWLTPILPAQAKTGPAGASLPAADKFSTAAAAAKHCPGGEVVWSTFSKSKVFHTAGSKYYGKTRHGAYVCEKDALAAGFHVGKR